jgi:enoyl-CoA hydratase
MPDLQVLSIERDGYVATVWLNRPEARNAMGPAFWEDLTSAMTDVGTDRGVRAVVVAARGPHFSVGLDLKAMAGLLTGGDNQGAGGHRDNGDSPPSMAVRAVAARAGVKRLQESISAVADCPKPVVAAIHGYCIGGGVDLASACDIRLASADAVFSVREGSLQRLPHIIGKGHVAELAYTGKDITADRAREIGLVNEVFPDADAVVSAAQAMAAEIASNSPLAVEGTKAVLTAGEGRSVAEGLDYVATWNSGFLQSDDLVEAMAAFVAKRAPEFRGR